MEKGNGLFHKLDRFLGIPIVLTLGILRKKNKSVPVKIGRIAVLNIGSIGDNVLMSAVIQDLRSDYADAEIIAFTGSTNYQLVKLIPGLNKVIKLPVTNGLATVKMIREEGGFDLLFDFGPWPRLNSIYAKFVKAKYKYGFQSDKQYRHYVYDKAIIHSSQTHEIENFRSLVSDVYKGINHAPQINVISTEKSDTLVKGLKKYCIIHPWPGGFKSYMKEWPDSNWVKLIEKIYDKFDHIVITGSPADKEKSDRIIQLLESANSNNKIINLSGGVNLQELAHLIVKSELVVSVNTGIAHMAAALSKKQVCLHGPTNVLRWGPYDDNTISVVPDEGHFGYLNYGYEYSRAKENCMENISVDKVYKAIEQISFI
ncbi:glycosyltransferase family 9 protein [Mucilaginibacter sp. SG564]|uniref:glycosyltransferase family 9 protein n=1 Tax=Mucilaginibacter sp. SG564 TaxID=2587022 RepID=UPI00155293BA|nr:glycosyltransferase family 9 protein [Mucilaginibacter sp. SG564]NOW95323.1 heptosyltransferase I [Mucilaginibacter sp. SG564]